MADGPFAALRLPYYQECARCGPGDGAAPHCLARNFTTVLAGRFDAAAQFDAAAVAVVQALPDYLEYHDRLEQGPHTAIHSAIGGDMTVGTSPNEPLFFLHHCEVDRLWSLWQLEDPEKRTYEFSGNRLLGSTANDALLEDVLDFGGLAGNVTVRSVMDILKGEFCYEY